MLRRLLFSVTAFLLLFAPLATPAYAADPASTEGAHLLTSSLPTELTADPGTTATTDIRLTNTGNEPEPVKVGLMKFTSYGTTGQPRLLDRAAGDDYFDWVSFDTNAFTLQPGEWKTVKVTVKIPVQAAFGYYLAATFTRAGGAAGSEQTSFGGGIASLILLDVRSPNTVRKMQITSFTTSQKVYQFLPATFNVTMQNTGNIYGAATGDIFIDRGDTHTLGTVDVNKASGSILPASSRVFSQDWLDGFPEYQQVVVNGNTVLDSKGKPVTKLSWSLAQLSKFRFGKYTAHLVMSYDDGNEDVPLEATTTFWVIPWIPILILLLILLIIGAGIYSIVRSIIRGMQRR